MGDSRLKDEIIRLVSGITETQIRKEDVKVNFIEGVNVDSLMALEIVAALEKKYKIEITEKNFPKLATIDSIAGLVNELTGNSAQGKAIVKKNDSKGKKRASGTKRKFKR
jgi:acyl carrier protein